MSFFKSIIVYKYVLAKDEYTVQVHQENLGCKGSALLSIIQLTV